MVAQEGQQFKGSAEGPKLPEGHRFFSAFHDHPIKAGSKCVTNCGMRKVKPGNNRLFDAHIAAEEAGTHSVMLGHSDPRTGKKLPVYSFGPKAGLEEVKTGVGRSSLSSTSRDERTGKSVKVNAKGERVNWRGQPWVGQGTRKPNEGTRGGRPKGGGKKKNTADNKKED